MALPAESIHRFTVDQYLAMAANHPDLERTELVGGVIVDMSPESWLHAETVRLFDEALNRACGGRSRRNGSVTLSSGSHWYPDVYVLRPGVEVDRYPRAAEIELVVEVAITSHERDLGPKRGVYAAEGIPNFWVVTLGADALIARCTHPLNTGIYRSVWTDELPDSLEGLDVTGWV